MFLRVILFFLFSNLSLAIINGEPGKISDFSSTVKIWFSFPGHGWELCTAEKIAVKTYLSAAHCFHGIKENPKNGQTIYLGQKEKGKDGSRYKNKIIEIYLPTTLENIRYLWNQDYENNSWDLNDVVAREDIAVFKVENEIPQITIAEFYYSPLEVGNVLRLAGYGNENSNSHRKNNLFFGFQGLSKKFGNVLLFKQTEKSKTLFFTKYIDPFGIKGDSGSSIKISENGKWKIAAVLSGGNLGKRVNTGVAIKNFIHWIQDIKDGTVEPTWQPINW